MKKIAIISALAAASLMAMPLAGCSSSTANNAAANNEAANTAAATNEADNTATSTDGKTVAELVVDTWALNGVTDANVFTTLDAGEEISTDNLEIKDTAIVEYTYRLKDDGTGTYSFLMDDSNNGVDSAALEYSIAGASATHCDTINVTIEAGGGDQTLYYDSANDQMIAGLDTNSDGTVDYTAVLTRCDDLLEIDGVDCTSALGTHTNADGDTIEISGDQSVKISITRLTEVEGSITNASEGVVYITCKDENGSPIDFSFVLETGELTVMNSSWDLLKEGDSFTFDMQS